MTPGFSDQQFEFAQGSVFGWRQWSWRLGREMSGATGEVWNESVMHAYCKLANSDHPAPNDKCSCGIYAYWQAPYLVPLCGVIEGYGKVILGELGFRCQHARIKALTRSLPWAYATHLKRDLEYFVEKLNVPLYDYAEDMLDDFPLTTEYLPDYTTTRSRGDLL